MQQQSELPEGWLLASLPKVVNIKMGQSPPGSTYNDIGNGLPFFQGKADFTDFHPIVRKYCTEPKKIANQGDILLSIRAPVGPTNIANKKCAIGRGLAALTPYNNIPTNFILYFFRFIEQELSLSGTGSTFKAINKQHLDQLEMPIPPLAEQHCIVLAIEALFARLDVANERLDRVPEIVKKFRQSVLAAACDGRLTEGWRAINEFTDSWKTTTIGEISDLTSGLHFKKSEYSEEGIRLLQITNVSFGIIKWEKTAFLPETYAMNYPELVLKPGDLLMALNRPLLGDKLKVSKLTESDCPSILYQRVGRFDIYDEKYKDYFYSFLRSPFFIERLRKDLQGVDQPFINKSKLLKMPIPLPPLPEQHEIVRRVDALFALADSIEAKVAAARERTEKMRQSILVKAFSGELVETEAEIARIEGRDYEPADVLLERIRVERGK